MRVASWEEFAQRAKKMYLEEPMRTRYLVRYNHDRSRLCVKVTDDVKVCTFDRTLHAEKQKVEARQGFKSIHLSVDGDFRRSLLDITSMGVRQECIQFKTDQAADVKKLDELNTFFLSLMAGMDVKEFAESCAAGETTGAAVKGPQTRRTNRKG